MSSNNLKKKYLQEIAPKLKEEFGLKNPLSVPKVKKVVINVGLGEGALDKSVIEKVAPVLAVITGQRPKIAKARVSVAGFKLRKGDLVGLVVTLRGERMYDFLEKLFKIVFPRLRDFQGVSTKNFDGRGNYNLGIPESTVFPEVDFSKVEKVTGLQITIVTNANDNQKAKRLLESLGMPFEKR